MKIDVLVAEIGSTTTVVNAFDKLNSNRPVFLGQGFASTSVDQGDVSLGLRQAIEALKHNLKIEDLEYDSFYASSSAAGGLKMTVHGLVYDMTVKAAKEAALGAGGNIKWVTSGKLTTFDQEEIQRIKPNLILLAGGMDYGESETALYNAKVLLNANLNTPIIYAGNCVNALEIKQLFKEANKADQVYITENIYPSIDTLNVVPARKIIQDVFEKHIIHAVGMQHIRELVNGKILPTPGAVMLSAQLLETILGDLLVLDLGGATTDVHSVTNGDDAITKMALFPEPKAKRTVEGDLGVFLNADHLIQILGKDHLMGKLGLDQSGLNLLIEKHIRIPKSDLEKRYIHELSKAAIDVAMKRHVGRLVRRYGGSMPNYAEGKDLTKIKAVIGTGGVLTRLEGSRELLEASFKNTDGKYLLPDQTPRIYIDQNYNMAALGLLSTIDKEAAVKLLSSSLKLGGNDAKSS